MALENHIRYDAKHHLVQTIIAYLKQTPLDDPEMCIIVEWVQPYLRSTTSEFICAIDAGDKVSM